MSNFEKAARDRLRFETNKGFVSVEDLWNMPLESNKVTSLDDVAIKLSQAIAATGSTSFVKKKVSGSAKLQLQFDIVKHIIDTLLAEETTKKKRAVAKTENAQIRALIADKAHSALTQLSVEELEAKLVAED